MITRDVQVVEPKTLVQGYIIDDPKHVIIAELLGIDESSGEVAVLQLSTGSAEVVRDALTEIINNHKKGLELEDQAASPS